MASKHELIAPNGDRLLIRQDGQGRIRKSDDLGESLIQRVRKRVTTTVKPEHDAKPEHGDRDQRH